MYLSEWIDKQQRQGRSHVVRLGPTDWSTHRARMAAADTWLVEQPDLLRTAYEGCELGGAEKDWQGAFAFASEQTAVFFKLRFG